MDPDADPVLGFARAATSLAEVMRRLEETERLVVRLQGFALSLLGLALLGTGFLVWEGLRTAQDHAASWQALTVQTQALQALLRDRDP